MQKIERNETTFSKHFKRVEEMTKREKSILRFKTYTENYLFVVDRNNQHTGWCSSCEKEVHNKERLIHNREIKCPYCKNNITIKHVWRGIKGIQNAKAMFTTFKKSAVDKNSIVSLQRYVYRNFVIKEAFL